MGHKARDCRNKKPTANQVDDVSLFASPEISVFNVSKLENEKARRKWCIDSGCSAHMCRDLNDFVNIDTGNNGTVNLASNTSTEIQGKGVAALSTLVNGKCKYVKLDNALHVPDLRTNLVSVGKITDKGFEVIFRDRKAEVTDKTGNVILTADRLNGLYYIRQEDTESCRKTTISDKNIEKRSLKEWHYSLGHLSLKDLREAAKNGSIKGLVIDDLSEDFQCETCLLGKMTRLPFPKKSTRSTEIGDITHSDVCGPMRVMSNGNTRYFVTFIDDASRWCEVRFLHQKSDVQKEFEAFKALMETQHGKKTKFIQSDNGKEYVNKNFDNFLTDHGMQRRLTAPQNPEQNGISERKNRSLVETARCLLVLSGLPASLWAEAVNTANYIRNRSPTSSLNGKTPYKILYGAAPDVSKFKTFGQEVFCLDRNPNKGKFEPRSHKGIFLGYSDTSKAYRI